MGGSWTRAFDTFNLFGMDKTSAVGSMPFSHSTSPEEEARNQANDLVTQQAAATKKLEDEKANASAQASAAVSARRKRALSGSQTIYTNPLGIGGQAATARKALLGQ